MAFAVNLMTIWAGRPQNADAAAIEVAEDLPLLINNEPSIMDKLRSLAPEAQEWWKRNGARIGGVFKALMFAAGAGFLIYQIVSGAKAGTINPIEGIGLGILSAGLLIKSLEALFATGIGNWLVEVLQPAAIRWRAGIGATIDGFFTGLRSVAQWFTEGVPEGSWAARILGKNASEFFTKRLGPTVAVLGIALAAWMLALAIKSGDAAEIAFNAVSVAFALAETVLMGLEIFGEVALAGHIGLAVAVLGLLVLAFQWIWNTYIHPKPPPPDPVEQFITGPLKDAGVVMA
jgi:hypothetical protein